MKLLDTSGNNTKVKKTNDFRSKKVVDKFGNYIRLASLSMRPDDILCPSRHLAGCAEPCLVSAGMGAFSNVEAGRQAKTDFFHNDREGFLDQLRRELGNFERLCAKTNTKPVVRLNTISDIQWERYGIPQAFPNVFFYDYTKIAKRLGNTPDNYRLMFSYSGKAEYQKQVAIALKHDVPISVVFFGDMPETFLGRRVIDGDASDLENLFSGKTIVGLKAKGKAKKSESDFVIDTRMIARVAA
jgi:hypothetical protein